MSELEIGEYVRTDTGFIKKIDSVFMLKNLNIFIDGKKIVKHSKNIAELLEIGDCVNGKFIEFINVFEIENEKIILLIYDKKNCIAGKFCRNSIYSK
jgi:hypothetical protein